MTNLVYRAKDAVTHNVPRAKGGEIPLILAKNMEYTPQGLTLYISTENGAPVLTKTDYVNCHYRLVDKDGLILLDTAGTGAWARIRGRGNTTWTFPKKPWKVKLTNTAKMLNLPTSKDWALLANYADQSRVKNAIAYEMFRRTSLAWSPRSLFVEVVLNGSYDGLYQFIESVETAATRNSITGMKATDVSGRNVTGGYRVEIEIREAQTAGWYTRLGQPFIPDDPELTVPEQLTYCKTKLQTLEDRLFAENFTDTALGYKPLIDVDSWIDWYLTTETLGSIDSGWGASIRMHWDRDATDGTPSKIKLGPPWDYDLTLGYGSIATNQWVVRVGAFPIARMLEDPAFVTRMQERWAVLKTAWTGSNSITSWASALWTSLTPQRERDRDRWSWYLQPISEVTAWLTDRIAWLDGQITNPSDTTPPAAPTGCTVGPLVSNARAISWTNAGDPANPATDIVGYRVRMNGVIAGIARTDSNMFLPDQVVIQNPTAGATFTVASRDRAGNWSAPVTAT